MLLLIVQYELFWITVWITAQSQGPRTWVTDWLWKSNLGFVLGAEAVDTRSAVRGPRSFDGLAETSDHGLIKL